MNKYDFWENVDIQGPDECWPWLRSVGGRGYGQTYYQGKTENSHRVAFILTHGYLPMGMYVLHDCDNPPCCNPAHLYAGNAKDNMKDMMKRRRGRFIHNRWGGQRYGNVVPIDPRLLYWPYAPSDALVDLLDMAQ